MGVLTIAIFNICGVTVTKRVSALARSIVDVTRTIVVWVVGLIITWSSNGENAWENTRWGAIGIEFIGFVILVSGNLIYNEILVLPFLQKTEELSEPEEEKLISTNRAD